MLKNIKKINGTFDWWDSEKRLLICPLPTLYGKNIELTLWQLEKLGCEFIGIIDMPLPFPHHFLQVKLPPFLSLEENTDDDGGFHIFCFIDEKKRQRLRVSAAMIMMHTNIWTKYLPQHERNINGIYEFIPCVIDTEFEEEDGDEDQRKVIWSTPTEEVWNFDKMTEIAEEWLNKNYPDWKDPSAYWS